MSCIDRPASGHVHASIRPHLDRHGLHLSTKNRPLVIATRESRLALWQAHHVADRLGALGYRTRVQGMTTKGDQILDRALSKVGGKGLFVKELEQAIEAGEADLAVHSLKDVPMELPAGMVLACVLEREDARDAFVSNHSDNFDTLPHEATIGTSSLRRMVQLRALRPDLRIVPLRGNLDTRLRKLDEGNFDAIVLASAGLKRLGEGKRIRHCFDPEHMLPAAGQGALAIEIRDDREDLIEVLHPLVHMETWLTAAAERAVSRELGGSCSMPLAAFAQISTTGMGRLAINAAWGDPDGERELIRVCCEGFVPDLNAADALGREAALKLRKAGAL